MTATGTIAIKVVDSNDHCPTLTTTYESLCSDQKTIYVTGFDEDDKPNGAPLSFRVIPEGTRGEWEVQIINGMKTIFLVRILTKSLKLLIFYNIKGT